MARDNNSGFICLCVTAAVVAFVFGIPQIGVSVVACLRRDELCGGWSNASKAVRSHVNCGV